MKVLTGKHVFAMARLIKAANLKEEIGNILASSYKNEKEVGIKVIMSLFESCSDPIVEKYFYELFDDVFESKVSETSIEKIIDNFKELAKMNNLTSFFKSAGLLR